MINNFNKHSININMPEVSPSAEDDLCIAWILSSLINLQTFTKILFNNLLTLYNFFFKNRIPATTCNSCMTLRKKEIIF